MSIRPLPTQHPKGFPDEKFGATKVAGAQSASTDLPGDSRLTHTLHETAECRSGLDGASRAKPGMPPLADHTLTDTHSCARLLAAYSDQLVVARTPWTRLPSVLYVVNPATGLVSSNRDQIIALSMEVADQLLAEYDGLVEQSGSDEGEGSKSASLPRLPSRAAIIKHAEALRAARAPDRYQKVVGGVLEHDLRHGRTLASRVVVRPHAALDADMSVIGTPKGVLDIRTLRLLHPTEAGARFISRSTGVEYRRNARDPHVDQILPPLDAVDHQSRIAFIMRWIGWHMTHPPRRDFLGLISEGNAGKSTLVNTIRAGLGDYAHMIRSEALAEMRSSGGPVAHNDELLYFGGGRRFVIVMEAKRFRGETVNQVSGGDEVAARPIRHAAVEVTVTAGLVIVGNSPGRDQDTGAVLGLAGDDEVSRALRDRARIVRLPRRGEDAGPRDDMRLSAAALPSNWTPGFREAVLARILEWAVVMVDHDDPPESTDEMVLDQAVQKCAESSDWERDFIPYILTMNPQRVALDNRRIVRSVPRPADTYSVYQEYLQWHESCGGGGSPAQRRAVTDALARYYYGIGDAAREGKINVEGDTRRHKTIFLDGYYICDLNVDGLRVPHEDGAQKRGHEDGGPQGTKGQGDISCGNAEEREYVDKSDAYTPTTMGPTSIC